MDVSEARHFLGMGWSTFWAKVRGDRELNKKPAGQPDPAGMSFGPVDDPDPQPQRIGDAQVVTEPKDDDWRQAEYA